MLQHNIVNIENMYVMTGPMGSHTTQEVALAKTQIGLDWTKWKYQLMLPCEENCSLTR